VTLKGNFRYRKPFRVTNISKKYGIAHIAYRISITNIRITEVTGSFRPVSTLQGLGMDSIGLPGLGNGVSGEWHFFLSRTLTRELFALQLTFLLTYRPTSAHTLLKVTSYVHDEKHR